MVGGIVCEALALLAFGFLSVVRCMKGFPCFGPTGTSWQPGPSGLSRGSCGSQGLATGAIVLCSFTALLFIAGLIAFFEKADSPIEREVAGNFGYLFYCYYCLH